MWKFILNMFGKSVSQDELMKKFLIVGLGNIGSDYEHTRHNIGFDIVNYMANKREIAFETVKLGDRAILKHKGRTFILLK